MVRAQASLMDVMAWQRWMWLFDADILVVDKRNCIDKDVQSGVSSESNAYSEIWVLRNASKIYGGWSVFGIATPE